VILQGAKDRDLAENHLVGDKLSNIDAACVIGFRMRLPCDPAGMARDPGKDFLRVTALVKVADLLAHGTNDAV